MMKSLDLFSSIGGFALGCEPAGIEAAAFCEIDPDARDVLAHHFPDVPIFDDVTTLDAQDAGPIDIICGGFPCQDLSLAGKGAGIGGSRSRLFYEIIRLAEEIRPRWLLLENVSALLGRGMEVVLGEIAALGYDAQWHCLPASAIGAPHRRDRIFIIAADPNDYGQQQPQRRESAQRRRAGDGSSAIAMADSGCGRLERSPGWQEKQQGRAQAVGASYHAANPKCPRLAFWTRFDRYAREEFDAAKRDHHRGGKWAIEPNVGRVVDGLPLGLDGLSRAAKRDYRAARHALTSRRSAALKQLGNAVVPACVEIFARTIARIDGEMT